MEEIADHFGERLTAIVINRAIDKTNGGRDTGPRGRFVLVAESLGDLVKFGPGAVSGEQGGPTVGEQRRTFEFFELINVCGNRGEFGRSANERRPTLPR